MKRTLVLSALAVASTLALAACGEATESGNTDATHLGHQHCDDYR